MVRPTRVIVNRQNLRDNLTLLKKWNGSGFFCPMVKANAYGHGDILVAQVVEETGASAMGVALYEEGIRLRQAGSKLPILAFTAVNKEAVQAAREFQITPVVGSFADLAAFDEHPAKIHIKFNSGMQRLGFDEPDVERLLSELKARPWLTVEGTCTHLTHGEEADRAEGPSHAQLTKFLRMSQGFPGFRHAHKSASLASRQGLDPDGIGARPGIGIYGLPHDGRSIGPGLKPVLSWKSQLINVHRVGTGETVSYSARWKASRPSVVGVMPLGYGDGYARVFSNKGFVLCRGQRVPVIGSVCMDYTLIDLTDLTGGFPKAGEETVLIGSQGQSRIDAVELAEVSGTIAYEIVTAISARVAREAV